VHITQIAGCNLDTLVEVRREIGPDGEAQFEFIRIGEGPDSGDGTVPPRSANLPEATVYYIQYDHRNLPSNRQVIKGTLDLIHGGETEKLPTDLRPREPGLFGRGVLSPADVEDIEAERLRQRLEDGTADAQDLSQLYFAM
jgi:hypothetical protein